MIQIQCTRADTDARPMHDSNVSALDEHQHQRKYLLKNQPKNKNVSCSAWITVIIDTCHFYYPRLHVSFKIGAVKKKKKKKTADIFV